MLIAKAKETWVILNDIQIPFQDRKCLDLVLDFIDQLEPDGVILNGDIVDCYSLSSFNKDPHTRATLDKEIGQSKELMERLEVIPHKIWQGGNHEDRLRRMLWAKAPGLVSKYTSFQALFQLQDHGFVWKEYGDYTMLGKLMVTHGDLVNKHSAYTAKNNFDKHGTSVIVGHTHRMGTFYKTDRNGTHVSYENGCLCRMDPEYVSNPNWQHAFAVVHVAKGGMFNIQSIPILNSKLFFYGSEVYVR